MNGDFRDRGACRKCGLSATEFVNSHGVDPCLGVLPGVAQACCGHGEEDPYVVIGGRPGQPCTLIANGVTLRGSEAEAFFDLVRNASERWSIHEPLQEVA